MKKLILICCLMAAAMPFANAQYIAGKTNAVGWAYYGTLNLGAEVALAPRWTIALDGYYNPWKWSDHKQSKYWALQLEGRYWFCHKFAGHFVGLHTQYADYNFGMQDYRYDGWLTGAGLSYGYAWPFAKHWRLEGNLGLGWMHKEFDKSDRMQYPDDIRMYDFEVHDTFAITKAGLSLVFLIF